MWLNKFSILVGLALAGCHQASTTPAPADLETVVVDMATADLAPDGGAKDTFPATLGEAMPQVVLANATGGVNTSPKVVVITYDNDPYRSDIEAFFTAYGPSAQWESQVSEYGIGAFTVGNPQHITGTSPASMTDNDVQHLLRTNLASASAAWGAVDTSTIYQIVIPKATTFSDGSGGCCDAYDGYHADMIIAGNDISYAVLCECDGQGPSYTALDELTVTASHETVEASTDAYPYSTLGYASPDGHYYGWTYATSGEIADLCEFADTANWKPAGFPYMLQRTWSNAAAAQGKDPCVGDPTTPYYQAIPYQGDVLEGGQIGDVYGVAIDENKTATVSVHVYADASVGPLLVDFSDLNSTLNGGTQLLSFTDVPSTVMPGDTFTVKVTVMGIDQQIGNGEVFIVNTRPVSGTLPTTSYYAFVFQP